MVVPREKLYAEVWAEPMTAVAKRYGISSNFLARVCSRLNVPHPARGYWAQVKVGRKLKQQPLPEPRVGDEIEWSQHGPARVHMPAISTTAVATKPKNRPLRGRRHSLLRDVREHFEAGRVSREEYLKPYKRNIVDIFVSKETLGRALDVANELFLTLEDRGHHVAFAPPDGSYTRASLQVWDEGVSRTHYWDGWRGPARLTIALVKGVAIGLTLFEVSAEFETVMDHALKKRVRKGPPRHQKPGEPFDWRIHNDWLTSGRLGLHAYAARSHIKWERYWREKKPGELRGWRETIARELEQGVPAIEKLIAQQSREAEEWRRKYEEDCRIAALREAERQKVEREARRETKITEAISRWRMAQDVRAYVDDIRTLVRDAGLTITADGGADQELNWALAYADRIDPLMGWRNDIKRVKAEAAHKSRPDCGKVHGAPDEQPASEETPGSETATGQRAGGSAPEPQDEDGR